MDKSSNLVKFPGTESEAVARTNVDPIEELMNEFKDAGDQLGEIPSGDHEGFQASGGKRTSQVVEYLKEQLEEIEDTTKRMKFYLDELETYTVKSHKG